MGRRPESQVCVPSLVTSPLWASGLSFFPMRGSNSAGSGETSVKPPRLASRGHSSSPLPGRGSLQGLGADPAALFPASISQAIISGQARPPR